MAKSDAIISELDDLLETDVDYKSGLTSTFFEKLAKNTNYLCEMLGNINVDVLTPGTTSWTAPANVKSVIVIGLSGGGGGGGNAPFTLGGGIDNATLYIGFNGGAGGASVFNGQTVATGSPGGQGFRYRANRDTGGGAQSENSAFPLFGFKNSDLYRLQGIEQASGGRGGYFDIFSTDPITGYQYGFGGGLGGEAGKVGFIVPTGIVGGGTYPVTLGAGGSPGANAVFSATWAANTGRTSINATFGEASPGMIVISMGF